jgi:DNA-binding SARP family transcriptional activator
MARFVHRGRSGFVTNRWILIVTIVQTGLYRIAMARRLSLEVLGPVRVELDGVPLVVDTRKAIALLAYLAVADRPASRATLAALLWPESDEPGAHGALRRTLSVLNRALGGTGLAIDRQSVGLRSGDLEVDLWQFRSALSRVREHDHGIEDTCPGCLGLLDEAIALDRGEFMAGFALRSSADFDDWQASQAETYRRELTGALERLARGRIAGGSWEAAIAAARRWLELDGLHEPAQRLLISALAAAGESAAALRQYRECVRILDHELGVAPLAETTALAETIRDGRFKAFVRPREAGPTARARAELPMPEAARRVSAFVGRAEELAALVAGYHAVGPDGRLLVIEGEAGIGKTRLAAALADRVREDGGTVVMAEAYGGETGIAFAPIVELIRSGMSNPGAAARLKAVGGDSLGEAARLMPLLPGSPDSRRAPAGEPFGRARLFEALADVLVALADGPSAGIVILDDLHRADASTLEFVGYLARRLRTRPIALAITWRPEEMAPGARDVILASAERESLVVRVDLSRLDREQVAELATVTLGQPIEITLADSLFERSEGLPLYVAEALAARDWSDERMPDGVVALLGDRIDASSAIARQILSAAAVIGRSFDLDIVRAASGRADEEAVDGLDELVLRRLIHETGLDDRGGVRYDFTHGRLRDVAYDRLSLARRRLLHGRVADAMVGVTDSGSDIGRWSLIAHHQALAGRSNRAADAHRQAGAAARSVFANAEAREHLEAALALGHPAVADIHGALGDVLTLLGDYDGAIAHLETALGLAGPEEEAGLDHRLGLVLARVGDRQRADRYLVAALVALGPGGDPGTRAEILADRGAIAHRDGDSGRAAQLATEALILGKAAGDPMAVARAEDLLGMVSRSKGDLAAARDHLGRSIAAADLAESLLPDDRTAARVRIDPSVRIAALNTLALVCADAGDRHRAIELTQDALRLCERQGDLHHQAALENNLADLFHAEGRVDDAMIHLKRAVQLFAEVGGRPGDLRPEVWTLVEW